MLSPPLEDLRGCLFMMLHKKYSPRYVVDISRKLRLEMTEEEKILWARINNKQLDGLRFRNQHPIGRYVADFYCHEIQLVIEIDGGVHDERKEYDTNRDGWLKAGGYTVLRFRNEEMYNNLDQILITIRAKAFEIRQGNSSKKAAP